MAHVVRSLVCLVLAIHACDSFNLTILHNNDFHSRFAPTSLDSSPCTPGANVSCIAGAARTTYLVS